jgi:predicted ABC-type sugar transport system permease subunit
MNVVAYLPQYAAELGGLALSVCAVITGLPALITGRSSATPDWSERRVRAAAAFGVLLLAVWGLLFAFVLPGVGGGPYGTGTKVVTGVWLFCLVAITGWSLWRELRYLRVGSANGI